MPQNGQIDMKDDNHNYQEQNGPGGQGGLAKTRGFTQVTEALDAALRMKTMLAIVGRSPSGKTVAVRAWGEAHIGGVRVLRIPYERSVTALLVCIAEALGVDPRGHGLRMRVADALAQTGLFLIFDDADHLFPSVCPRRTILSLLDWLRVEIIDRHIPHAFVLSQLSGWGALFFARGYRVVHLPDAFTLDDMLAVARIQFPTLNQDELNMVVEATADANNYLAILGTISALAQHSAHQANRRRLTVKDIQEAIKTTKLNNLW
jgi:hypothetical protein